MLFKWFSRILHIVVFLILLFIFTYIFAPILIKASPISNVDLADWSLRLYNASNGKEYDSFNFNSWSYIDIANQAIKIL